MKTNSSTKQSRPFLVYLIDDNDRFRSALKTHIEEVQNVSVKTFSSGETCLEEMGAIPDFVILDYWLDDKVYPRKMMGIEVLMSIKDFSPDTDIIMLSSWENMDVAVDTLKLGACDYIVKDEHASIRVKQRILNSDKYITLCDEMIKKMARPSRSGRVSSNGHTSA